MSGQSLLPLLTEFRRLIGLYDHPQLDILIDQFDDPLKQDRVLQPTSFPVLAMLPGYLSYVDKRYSLFADLLGKYLSEMCWYQSYTESDFGKEFIENYAYSEIIGSRGPLVSDVIAAGVFVIGPNMLYPSHSHEAQEFYFPLTPGTLFQHDGEPWVETKPGSLFYNQSWQPHSIKTQDLPMIILYLWYGGKLVQKSRITRTADL